MDFYSNALYTLFTFNHEPFGYIPVESMACGTPVLTYNAQGPSETVIEGQTGWPAKSNNELENFALQIWKNHYPLQIRKDCRMRALEFDSKIIGKKWLEIIKHIDLQKN